MMNFQAHALTLMLTGALAAERRAREMALLAHIHGDPSHPEVRVDEATVAEAKKMLGICVRGLSQLGVPSINGRLDHFTRWLELPMMWSDLEAEWRTLREAVQIELKEHHFYHYSKERGDKVAAFKGEWGSVWPNNKAVQDEALSAVDCYALEHPTASVFHSMRVAEHGLRAVAYERGIKKIRKRPIEWENWKDIIKALSAAAEKVENRKLRSKTGGAKKDHDLAFYKGVIADLDSFRVEFRNMVMHVRATYDDMQALRALERVRAFMQRVSSRIDESGKRIRT